MDKKIKRLCLASSAITVAALGMAPVGPAWAISGNVQIESDHATYSKGDDVKLEIKIKADDGADFLLQTDIQWSSGMTLKSVSGDSIQYNRGKIVGTAPKSEFVINITLTVQSDEDQSIQLTDVKMGSVDGSPNYTIDKSSKIIDVKEPVVETQPPATEPPVQETTPPETEPPVQETEPAPTEPAETPYTAWKATVTVNDTLNVREGPGLNYYVVDKYVDGDKIVVTDEKQVGEITWLKVDKGWISKDYVVEGHIEAPEKTDEEIEKEQQAQIKNEAQTTEDQNQANNEAAQKKDEEKKQEYDEQEQAAESATVPSTDTEETQPPLQDMTELEEELLAQRDPAQGDEIEPGKNPITAEAGSSYVQYLTDRMSKPFYLYLEAYSLKFPDDFEKVSQPIGGLDFLMAIPTDLSIRKPNVFLAYGNYDKNAEPALYYFDKETDSFFPYESMMEKTVIVDKTIPYEKKTFSKSHIICGILGILGIYAAGALTTAIRYKKKEKDNLPPEPPKPTHSIPTKNISKTCKPDPEAVKDMTDDELDELLKVYGASTSDILHKKQPQPVEPPKPPIDENKGKKMEWNALESLMKAPENIQEAPKTEPPKVEPETEKEDTDDAHIDNEEPVVSDESVTEPKVEIPSQDDKVSAAQQELHEVATAIAQLDEDEEPVIALDLKFEAEPAKDVIVDDLQLEFDKAVAEDKLNPSEQDSPND